MSLNINQVVFKAQDGNKQALEQVILEIKELIYNLSLKMLLFPEDAKDITQDILIRVITNLGSFKGESTFTTWVYRVASNHLLTVKAKGVGRSFLSFDDYGKMLDSGHADQIKYSQNLGEQKLLEEEVKVSCTHGMLQCLNPSSRLVFILGGLLQFNSTEGSKILNITPEDFRQQLSRSRKKLRNFMEAKCGLANSNNPCRCKKKVDFLIDQEMIIPNELRFAQHTSRSIELVDKIDSLDRSVAIFRTTPALKIPESVYRKIKQVIDTIEF